MNRKTITLVTAIIFVTCLFYSCENNSGKVVEIIGHRGAAALAPENTLASVNEGLRYSDGVEIDVHLSKDNRVMVIHDSNTLRTTGENYKVSETSSDILRSLNADNKKGNKGEQYKIPFLEEVIDVLPKDKKLFIEIKSGMEILKHLGDIFNNNPKRDQLVIISFNKSIIKESKKLFKDIPAYWLTSRLNEKNMQKLADELIENGIDGFDLHYKNVTPEVSKYLKSRGLGMYVWTVNNMKLIDGLIKLNVDGITTDRPDRLLKLISK